MDQAAHNKIVSFIWGIADDVLRDLFVRGKYRDVILPMCVLRRLDAVLEPTKRTVLDQKKMLDDAGITEQRAALCAASKESFYNTSPYTLKDLKSRTNAQQLESDFHAYLDGFSSNVQDILNNFEFRNVLSRLSKNNGLGTLIEKFLDPEINLSPKPVLNGNNTVKHPAMDNHSMGTVFEELVRKFNEENNEEAGEHWTPRDAVKLMARLIFEPVADRIESGSYTLYDGAAGTGGMLTVAEETLKELADKRKKQVKTYLYGQEINPETYAICKADMLLKGEGENADHIIGGAEHSTLRYLCLLAILCDPEPPALIGIEEPELGLHPDMLPKLADLLIEASERTQLVVTTHSDTLVDAMTDRPEAVVVVEKHDGKTEAKRLEADKELKAFLEKYRLGQLWTRGELGGVRW